MSAEKEMKVNEMTCNGDSKETTSCFTVVLVSKYCPPRHIITILSSIRDLLKQVIAPCSSPFC